MWSWATSLHHGVGAFCAGLSILILAWMAGIRADVAMLVSGWMVVVMAGIAWVCVSREQRARQACAIDTERLEEQVHQAHTGATQLAETLAGTRQRTERYVGLQALARGLGQVSGVGQVCHALVQHAKGMIGKSADCLLYRMDLEHQRLALTASAREPGVPPIQAKQGDAFDHIVLRTRRGLLVEDVTRHSAYDARELAGRSVRSVVAVPILIDRRVEGILRLDSDEPATYMQEDLRLLGVLAELGATALATARLYEQTQALATTDSLTGLLVRRAFMERLQQELRRAQRNQEPRTVLMVDIDYFKRYNDTHGHTAGDMVLQGVARLLQQYAGPDGFVARYGGEEFTVLLSPADPQQATCVSEQMCQAAEREAFFLRREATHITISVGLAQFPHDGCEAIELLRIADQRLYQAKQAGRNCVCGVT